MKKNRKGENMLRENQQDVNMNRCQKETSSERYRRKQQELQDKINKMSSEEKIA